MVLFVFWYPLIMSIVWIIGSLIFHFSVEKNELSDFDEPPFVSILVPCYNEQETISKTIEELNSLNYLNYEIIAINDGSSDNTSQILVNALSKYHHLRIIQIEKNAGKANALYAGFMASKGEYIVGIDADSYLDRQALNYMIPHFKNSKVGAVTGNPRVRNRSTLLSKMQLCEFSSIIGQIKRTQRVLGKIMTVSGVVVTFRKRALMDCGLWDKDIITEDIGVTWKLQKAFWDVRYEPRAICWMLVPETIVGLWKQRVRWAQGGLETILRHWKIIFNWKQRGLIPILMEQILSTIWSIMWVASTIMTLIDIIFSHESKISLYQPQCLIFICLVQFFISMKMDSKYDKGFIKYYLWAIWYPSVYWYINALVVIRAIPKALLSKKGELAVWESPDRGI